MMNVVQFDIKKGKNDECAAIWHKKGKSDDVLEGDIKGKQANRKLVQGWASLLSLIVCLSFCSGLPLYYLYTCTIILLYYCTIVYYLYTWGWAKTKPSTVPSTTSTTSLTLLELAFLVLICDSGHL